MKTRFSRPVLIATAVALGSFASPVFAYLDPSTGSMILSAIVGILATLGLALKTYWYKLKSFFRSDNSAGAEAAETAASADSEPD